MHHFLLYLSMHPHRIVATPAFPGCISAQGCAGVAQVLRQWRKWVMLGSDRHTAVPRCTPTLQDGVCLYTDFNKTLLYEEFVLVFCHLISMRILYIKDKSI